MRAEINLKGPNAFDRFRELNVCGNIATINSEEDFPILIDQIKETKIKKIQIYPNNLQTCYYREDGWEIVIRQEIWKYKNYNKQFLVVFRFYHGRRAIEQYRTRGGKWKEVLEKYSGAPLPDDALRIPLLAPEKEKVKV